MKTVTIKLPDYLNESLNAAATHRKLSKSAVVRELLMQALPHGVEKTGGPKTAPSLHDRLQKYQAAGATGVIDLASNPEHLADYGH